MAIQWRDTSISNFMIHAVALGESGEESGETYNYYLYIHPIGGDALILREKTDGTEYRYAGGGIRTDMWADRATLGYVTYDQLA